MNKPLLISAITTSLLLTGCGNPKAPEARPLLTVNAITLAAPEQLSERIFTGQVEAADLTKLAYRIEGKLQQLMVRSGQTVTKGQLLAKLDDATQRQAWNEADAQYQLQARNLERSKQLLDKGLLAQSEFDELSANMRLARVNLAVATAQLGYTELRAPFDGYIDKLSKEQHETVAAGEPVMQIYRSDRTDVTFQYSDQLLMQVNHVNADKNYQPEVLVEGVEQPIPMTALEHSLQLEPSSGAYGTRLTSFQPLSLIPGQAVQIRIDLAAAGLPVVHGFQVPIGAVQPVDTDTGFQIWRLDGGQVTPVPVTIAQVSHNGLIISGDIHQGEQLVTSQLAKLRPNISVQTAVSESQR